MSGLVYADRVQQYATSAPGTSAFPINTTPSATGYQTFQTGVGYGKPTSYVAWNGASQWEVGWGIVTSGSPDTLTRLVVLASSNGGALTNFNSGAPLLSQNVPATFANVVSNPNKLINADMAIDQRNIGNPITPAATAYVIDRWYLSMSVASKLQAGQNLSAVTPPVGAKYYLGVKTVTAYTVGAGDSFNIGQVIEGLNIDELGWGAANALPITLSFFVYSTLTGNFGGSVCNNGGTRSYPFSYNIPTASTWTLITITIPGDTTGTWLTTTGAGIILRFGLGVGSTLSGTANTWAASNFVAPTSSVSVVGTLNAVFNISNVKLEVGNIPTAFTVDDYSVSFAKCCRYYYRGTIDYFGYANGSNTVGGSLAVPVAMRAAPSIALLTSASTYAFSGANVTMDSIYQSNLLAGTNNAEMNLACSVGTVSGAYYVRNATYTFDADL